MKKIALMALAIMAVQTMNAQVCKDCNKQCNMNDKNCEKKCCETKKTRSATFQYEKDLKWEDAEPGVVRQIMGYDGQVMLVKVKFEKGAIGKAHSHYHTQVSYVASGKFEVTIGGKKTILSAGDGFYVAPDTEHGVVCLEAGMLIDTFSPMRATFIGLK